MLTTPTETILDNLQTIEGKGISSPDIAGISYLMLPWISPLFPKGFSDMFSSAIQPPLKINKGQWFMLL